MSDIDKLGDLKKLFKKSAFEVTSSTDTQWTVEFTSGRYVGYTLVVTGEGLLGSTPALSGTITSITVTPDDDGDVWTETGLSLSASEFLTRTKLDRLIDESGTTIDGDDNNNKLRGDDGDDTLNGFGGEDRLRGDKGNDILNGGDDNDRLEGDKGSDTLTGGAGDDRLRGGKDNDTFVFTPGGGNDRVDDFEGTVHVDDDGDVDDDNDRPGEGDVLDFSAFNLDDLGTLEDPIDTIEEILEVTGAEQVGADVVFTLESGATTITLKEVVLANLTANDFAL